MILKTQGAASHLENAPSKPYLCRISKTAKRPGYFIPRDGKLMVDIEHPEWVEMVNRRADAAQMHTQPGVGLQNLTKEKRTPLKKQARVADKPVRTLANSVKTVRARAASTEQLAKELAVAKLKREKRMLELADREAEAKVKKVELQTTAIQKDIDKKILEVECAARNLIQYDFAEFYFFSYLDRSNSALLKMVKKLGPKIENLVLQQKTDKLIKLLQTEIESTISEIKILQIKSIKELDKDE